MGHVRVAVDIDGVSDEEAFDLLSDFGSYPRVTGVVRAVTVRRSGDEALSEWEVSFRKGILKWAERDTFDQPNREISFVQRVISSRSPAGGWRANAVPTA
jgi:hypothetical protein